MNVLMTYRLSAFESEIMPQFERFKDDEITFVAQNMYNKTWLPIMLKYTDLKPKLNIVTVKELLEGKLDNMQFDYIVGNPPYQDGKNDGGQNNKIYNLISKKCLSLLSNDGAISFITPVAVLRFSKRFSIIGTIGLESVDFRVNSEFDIGVNICAWRICKSKTPNNVKVTFEDGTSTTVDNGVEIYAYKNDIEYMTMYNNIKSYTLTKKDNRRMFYHNDFSSAFIKEKTQYPIFDSSTDTIVKYSTKQPLYYRCKKFVISKAKAQKIEKSITSYKDYDMNHLFIPYNTETELKSIHSFIFNEWFIEFCNVVKKNLGHGFNQALLYLPKFSLDIIWDEEKIKLFLKSYNFHGNL